MQLKNTTAKRHRIRLIVQMNLKVTFKAAHGRDGTENMQQPRSDKKKKKKKKREKKYKEVSTVYLFSQGAHGRSVLLEITTWLLTIQTLPVQHETVSSRRHKHIELGLGVMCCFKENGIRKLFFGKRIYIYRCKTQI